ncbi:MAG: hypothetical protein HY924_10810 [Elusimicrobia bacterium]|nr:hypothetical protein [Elusimicrobiota bacterium]
MRLSAGSRLRLVCVGLISLSASLFLSWEADLAEDPGTPLPWSATARIRTLTYGQTGEDSELPRPPGAAFKRVPLSKDIFEIQLKFKNFNNDPLKLDFHLVQADVDGSLNEFGYSKKDLEGVFAKYGAKGQEVYDEQVKLYFVSRGFKQVDKGTVAVDVPQLIWRNMKRVNSLALGIQRLGEQMNYDSEEVIGAATAMVQTALAYRIPPESERGRRIGGVHTPPQVLYDGWGDCDSKSALLASILSNWKGIRGVGVALPRHFLLGIARLPRQGDVFLEHKGVQYVLIEPAGPAWLPIGQVSDYTTDLLNKLNGVPIQPF